MNVAEIQDWQFGRLTLEERWTGGYDGQVEWTPGLTIDLFIYTHGAELNTIIERARTIFNTLRDRMAEFQSLAARDLLEAHNEILKDVYDDKPIDAQSFIDQMHLERVEIDPNGESVIMYSGFHHDICVTVSPDLSFKDALFS